MLIAWLCKWFEIPIPRSRVRHCILCVCTFRSDQSSRLSASVVCQWSGMLQAGTGGAHRPEASTSGNGITVREQGFRNKLGDRGYARFEALKKSERQRGQSTAV
jgi:hypothetical protein